jgi:hypothetical protein
VRLSQRARRFLGWRVFRTQPLDINGSINGSAKNGNTSCVQNRGEVGS